jgi:hypothetical protein
MAGTSRVYCLANALAIVQRGILLAIVCSVVVCRLLSWLSRCALHQLADTTFVGKLVCFICVIELKVGDVVWSMHLDRRDFSASSKIHLVPRARTEALHPIWRQLIS